jgi:hypothetical protein
MKMKKQLANYHISKLANSFLPNHIYMTIGDLFCSEDNVIGRTGRTYGA